MSVIATSNNQQQQPAAILTNSSRTLVETWERRQTKNWSFVPYSKQALRDCRIWGRNQLRVLLWKFVVNQNHSHYFSSCFFLLLKCKLCIFSRKGVEICNPNTPSTVVACPTWLNTMENVISKADKLKDLRNFKLRLYCKALNFSQKIGRTS